MLTRDFGRIWFWYPPRPGKQHGNADSLSRGHCQQCGTTLGFGTNVVVESTDNCLVPRWTTSELCDLQQADPDIQQMAHWINEDTLCQKVTLKMSVIIYRRHFRDKRLQLALPQALVPSVLTELHNSPTAGHHGVMKTLEKVHSRFYWRQDVENWCHNCENCGSRKSPVKHPRAPMQIERTEGPMQHVALDWHIAPVCTQLRVKHHSC